MTKADQLLFQLFHVGISIHHLNKRTEKQVGVSLVQWCLLKHLVDMPATSAHLLSTTVGVHPSTLTQTLKRLEKKKFIFVVEDPRDSRKKLISIAREGKDVLESATRRVENISEGMSSIANELTQVQSQLKRHVDGLNIE